MKIKKRKIIMAAGCAISVVIALLCGKTWKELNNLELVIKEISEEN